MRDIWKEGLYGTALGAAAFAGHKTVIEQLLDHGTDKNLVDSHERNALPFGTGFLFCTTLKASTSFIPDTQAPVGK